MSSCVDEWKRQAAARAVKLVVPGMVVGLGHGTTAAHAVKMLAALHASGRLEGILTIPCSDAVEREARDLGLPTTSLERTREIDVTIDGADEVAPDLDLIKGGGGALLREKIVAQASRREVIVVDATKLSPVLGTRWPVPVEVVPFGWSSQDAYLVSLGARTELRQMPDGLPFLTDHGNYLLDCHLGPLDDPAGLALSLDSRAGIVAHGLFLGIASDVIVAGPSGVRHLRRPGPEEPAP